MRWSSRAVLNGSLAFCALLFCGGPASAQGAPARVELRLCVALAMPSAGGLIASTYAPPLLAGSALDSSATQTLVVDSGHGPGFELGADVFLSRVAGVQAIVSYTRADIGGTNGPYDVRLRYVSLPPPDNIPREVTYQRSTAWPETAGSLRHLTFALGGVVGWRQPRSRVGGTVAGGVALDRVMGEIESLGYTAFRLGGHSVLFPFEQPVVVSPGGAHVSVAPYVAGDLHVTAGGHAAVVGGMRVQIRSARAVPLHVKRLLNPDEDPGVRDLGDIERDLALQPLSLPGTRWQVFGGIKVFLGGGSPGAPPVVPPV